MKINQIVGYFVAFITIVGMVSVPADISAGYDRNVVCEEITGTWCMYCPSGIVAIEEVAGEFGDRFIPISVHYNDVMAIDDYVGRLMSRIGQAGAPYAYTMRTPKYSGSVSDLKTRVDYLLLSQAEAMIEISAEYEGKTIRVNGKIISDNDISKGDWSAELILTENNVYHPGNRLYDQSNAYAESELPMGGFESLPDPIPSTDISYQDVSRRCDVLPENVVGVNLCSGEKYFFEYEMELPENVDNVEECWLTGLLIDRKGSVINAWRCQLKMSGDGIWSLEKTGTILTGRYDLSGNRVSSSQRGMVIEIYDDGSRRKILIP